MSRHGGDKLPDRPGDQVADTKSVRDDGQARIGGPTGWEKRTINHKHVVQIVQPVVRIQDAASRVLTEFAGAAHMG